MLADFDFGYFIGMIVSYLLFKLVKELFSSKKTTTLFGDGGIPTPRNNPDPAAPKHRDAPPAPELIEPLASPSAGTSSNAENKSAVHEEEGLSTGDLHRDDTIPAKVAGQVKPPGRRRLAWSIGVATVIASVTLYFISYGRYRPSIKVWDRAACERENFPSLGDSDKVDELRSRSSGNFHYASAKMFCSREWNAASFINAESILRNKNLLKSQIRGISDGIDIYEMNQDYGRSSSLDPTTLSFLRVVDVGPPLLQPELLDHAPSGVLFMPSTKEFEAAGREIDLDRVVTAPQQLPQAYTIRTRAPAIHLVTNVGLRTTLRELLLFGSNGFAREGRYQVAKERLERLTGKFDEDLNTNPYALAAATSLAANFRLASFERTAFLSRSHENKTLPFPDLEILYLQNDSDFPQPAALQGREGRYDVNPSRILVRAPEIPPLEKDASYEKSAARLALVVPASLDHEFYHYLFYRPSVSFSGFILEGEAMANGEIVHQMFDLGANQSPANAQDGFRALFAKVMDEPEEGASDRDISEFQRMADERMSNAPYTVVQCDSLQKVYETNVVPGKPIDLIGLLSLSPEDFQRASDLDLAYSQAWAVFQVEMIQKKEWGDILQRTAKKLTSHGLVSEPDRKLLAQISSETIEWVKNQTDRNVGCKRDVQP
jgi:hypothetical protein